MAKSPAPSARDWPWGLALILAVVVTYLPVLWAGYIWDDDVVLTNNPVIVGPLGLWEIWTTDAADICPLTLTTFWFAHQLWGLAPFPYHLLTVLFHAASALVLWRLLLALRIPGAWLGAALWALHPVMTESVAWISELKNTQSGLFYLLSILYFVKSLQEKSPRNYPLTLLFAALAMASKSSTVVLPLMLCLAAVWIDRRWQWKRLAQIAPVFAMALIAGLVSIATQKAHGADLLQTALAWPQRLVLAGDTVWFYLGKLIFFYPLLTIYPKWPLDPTFVAHLPLIAVIALLILFWILRKSNRHFLFALAAFLIPLLPVLGLIHHSYLRYAYVADHLQYLAAIAPLAFIGAGLTSAAIQISRDHFLPRLLFGGIPLFILAAITLQQTFIYQSQQTLWTYNIAHDSKCWVGYNILGHLQFQQGNVDAAQPLFQLSANLNPHDAEASYNLGVLFDQKDQFDVAMALFRRAIAINPDHDKAHSNLGVILYQKGRNDEAIAEYRTALQINPLYADAHRNLGIALATKGNLDEAIAHYQQALTIAPDDTDAHVNLANALFNKSRLEEAITHYQRALQLNPNDPAVHNNLGTALFQTGHTTEAITEYQKALQLRPDYANAQQNLTKAQALLHHQ